LSKGSIPGVELANSLVFLIEWEGGTPSEIGIKVFVE
jgi:hypothetical protein